MLTASQKRKENIAEYLLYMWQIEDLVRANGLDIDRIQTNIIDRYTDLSEQQRREMRDWYESLIDMMRREDVKEKGHLQINRNTLMDLERLHRELLHDPEEAAYAAEFYKTLPYIVEIRAKAGDAKVDEIETGFTALYGLLLLRIQGKEISQETQDAAAQISRLLARLAKAYKEEAERDNG